MAQSKTTVWFSFPVFLLVMLVVISGVIPALQTGGFIVNFKEAGFSITSTAQLSVHSVAKSIGGTFTAIKELSDLRKDYEATNTMVLNDLLTEQIDTRRGCRYTINMTIRPTYLYMLSEQDLDNPAVEVGN